jgi:hypothetical protein
VLIGCKKVSSPIYCQIAFLRREADPKHQVNSLLPDTLGETEFWAMANGAWVSLHDHRNILDDTADGDGHDYVAEEIKRRKREAKMSKKMNIDSAAKAEDAQGTKDKQEGEEAEKAMGPPLLYPTAHDRPAPNRRVTRSMGLGLAPPLVTASSSTVIGSPSNPGTPVRDNSDSDRSLELVKTPPGKRKYDASSAAPVKDPKKKRKEPDAHDW